MKRFPKIRFGASAFVGLLLATLATGAPLINANDAPPRSMFLTLPGDVADPTIALTAAPLASGDWLLEIETTGFRFTEICVSNAEAIPVGHAHIVRNGVKVASAYQPIADLGVLPPGEHRISVILRGQDHRALVGREGLIVADMTLSVPGLPEAFPTLTASVTHTSDTRF